MAETLNSRIDRWREGVEGAPSRATATRLLAARALDDLDAAATPDVVGEEGCGGGALAEIPAPASPGPRKAPVGVRTSLV